MTAVTKDVSSAGAFIVTRSPLPEGVDVKLELLLSMDALWGMLGEQGKARVRIQGKVVRTEGAGMAIRFGNRFKIVGGALQSMR